MQLMMIAGKDPEREPSGGHSSYVRAHARAARRAGYDPVIYCIGHRAENGYWAYGRVLHDAVPGDAAAAMDRLRGAGIGTRPFFWPMHAQPVWRRRGWFTAADGPVAARLGQRGFYLPGGLGLTQAQVERVCEAVREGLP